MHDRHPSEGHRRLERLAGTWQGEEHMHPSDWDPQGGTADGVNVSRMALGGYALVNDYEQRRDGAVTFTGHGMYSYDAEKDLYTLYWMDSMGSPPEVFTGRFEGDVLTMQSESPQMKVRLVWDLSRHGTMASSMEMSRDGVEWKRLFDAEYRKQD